MCLYCRQEARIAARRRRTRMLVRIGGIAVAAGAVIAVLGAALVAIAPWSRSNVPEAAELTSTPAPKANPKAAPRRVESRGVAAAATPSTVASGPIVAEGRTDLGDSVFADRSGNDVVVHFDNSTLRTRFEEKFERTVRMTVPRVFGADVRAALDAVAPGTLVRGELLRELPVRGIQVPLASGQTFMLYPMTRPGETGPLVVAYRAFVR